MLYESDELSGKFEGSISEPGVLVKQYSLNEDMVNIAKVTDDTIKTGESNLKTLLSRVNEGDRPLGRLIYNGFFGLSQLLMVSIKEIQSAKEEARSAKEEARSAKEEARSAKEEARSAKEEAIITKCMLEMLLEEKRLKEIRSEKRKNRKVQPKRDPVSEAQLNELINKRYPHEVENFERARNRLCMVLLWCGGLRINEAMFITLDQMKPLWKNKNPHLRVYRPKQRSYHRVFLTDRGARVLKWVKKDLEMFDSVVGGDPKALLYGSKQNPLKSVSREHLTREVNVILRTYFSDNDINIKSHSFKVSFINDYWTLTKDLELVRQLIGHETIATTQRYVREDEKGRLIKLEGLDLVPKGSADLFKEPVNESEAKSKSESKSESESKPKPKVKPRPEEKLKTKQETDKVDS